MFILLCSEGFNDAKNLSRKMVQLYKLASEQLSQQVWGGGDSDLQETNRAVQLNVHAGFGAIVSAGASYR